MKHVVLFSVFVFSLFVLFSCSDSKDGDDQVVDNRLPSSEVLELLKSNLLDKDGDPIGISDGQVETNRELAVGGALEAIVCYSATHEGIEFLLPWKEGDSFSYSYTLRDDRGTITIKSSDKDGYCAEMTLRVPEFPEITRVRFMKWNAFWHENNSEIPTSMDVESLGSGTSVNSVFAKLQLELAAALQESVRGYAEQIQKLQGEQKEVVNMLQRCRELQKQAIESGSPTEMPADIRVFMDQHSLAYDVVNDKDGWDVVIQSLQAYQERLGVDVQTLMKFVQDSMGQYHSYLQHANAAIHPDMQTLTSLANGLW